MKDKLIFFLVSFIPELAVSYLIIKILNENDDMFWIVFFFIQGLHFILWVFRSITIWIIYEIRDKDQRVNQIYDILVEDKFPDPCYFSIDSSTYFYNIVDNQSIKPEIRIGAAWVIAQFKIYESHGHFQLLWKTKKCAELAVEKYMNLNFMNRKK